MLKRCDREGHTVFLRYGWILQWRSQSEKNFFGIFATKANKTVRIG